MPMAARGSVALDPRAQRLAADTSARCVVHRGPTYRAGAWFLMSAIEVVSVIASIATVVAAGAVVATAVIYFRQLGAMTKSRELDSVVAILNYVDDLQLRRARYLMLEHHEDFRTLFDETYTMQSRRAVDARIRELTAGEVTVHHIDLALNAFNNVCFLLRFGYAPDDAGILVRNSLLRAWDAFRPYIFYRRSRPGPVGEPSQYGAHFEWVVCNKYGVTLDTKLARQALSRSELSPKT